MTDMGGHENGEDSDPFVACPAMVSDHDSNATIAFTSGSSTGGLRNRLLPAGLRGWPSEK
eukprot:CAMPEP_0178442854 /NCGR_PEP_ID=MMETSP0689_2-20121128/38463_1 /TAXON_ID=160604 /ORGANISM="Amphidinium massartii, Strain CS-259" /LENGTH=59 /DNA_ID=CAMNT_0020066581 /DNA_START=147 /DNA_END=326 /DNA_ORIENTATION=-